MIRQAKAPEEPYGGICGSMPEYRELTKGENKMKKTRLFAALLAAALLASGCAKNDAPAADTKKADDTTASQTEESKTEKTEDTSSSEAPETDAPEDDGTGKTVFFTAAGGSAFYREDTTPGDFDMVNSDRAVVRISSGTYHDSDTEPELFSTEEFQYNGERADLGETALVKAGDTVGGVKIASASTTFNPPWSDELGGPDPNAAEGFTAFNSAIEFEGELKLTGIVRYYYDDQYAIASGDIFFIPDASYKGLPLSVDPNGGNTLYGTTDFDIAGGYDDNYYGGNVCVYTDAPRFFVGNLNELGSSNTALVELLDGGNANCTKKVEITLTNVSVTYSDQFGTSHNSATIKDITLK